MDVEVKSTEQALVARRNLSNDLRSDPYNIAIRVARCKAHEHLGYPDLAVMDAYKGLLLLDELADDSGEYHEAVLWSLRAWLRSEGVNKDLDIDVKDISEDVFEDDEACSRLAERTWRVSLLFSISNNLHKIGCERPACEFAYQMLQKDPDGSKSESAKAIIAALSGSTNLNKEDISSKIKANFGDLPDAAYVRREVYPWNEHETERHSKEALDLLNGEMKNVAPKLEVRVTDLPALPPSIKEDINPDNSKPIKQLGVFAKEQISPGESILRERSLLTGNSRLFEPLCDACSAPLPNLVEALSLQDTIEGESKSLVPCDECDDTIFCSQDCHDLAQDQYHPAVCGMDVDAIGKDMPPAKAADSLYALLLFRALAMAQTQNTHPLDLKEVKYIWGDFNSTPASSSETGSFIHDEAPRTLPFSFEYHILTPLHLLEKMDINIFDDPYDLSELWVWNTLYAKFRGTASARISPRDGRPEVAAVHPLWCLANHSCDPNVRWEWAGEIQFHARHMRTPWTRKDSSGNVTEETERREPGIRKGEEIFSHYVDIDLPVKDRREWGIGALGGLCMCPRCEWESLSSQNLS